MTQRADLQPQVVRWAESFVAATESRSSAWILSLKGIAHIKANKLVSAVAAGRNCGVACFAVAGCACLRWVRV